MKRRLTDFTTPSAAVLGLFVQGCIFAMFVMFVCEQDALSQAFFSNALRNNLVETVGGEVKTLPNRSEVVFPLPGVLALAGMGCLGLNAVSLLLNQLFCGSRRNDRSELVIRNLLWTIPILLWCLLLMASPVGSMEATLAAGIVNLVFSLSLAGWIWEMFSGRRELKPAEQGSEQHSLRAPMTLGGMIALVVVTFTAMNWALWWNLRIPHGDSVMYEEHIWNFWHGKGFRSYLDQGLFLGEHIQVVHLLLSIVYWIWPSHLMLELCETVALSLGAIPTYLLTRRRSGNSTAALFVSAAYLVYFPMHYLDIAIDIKTFRPISFGVPCLLWGIYAMEQKRWKQMSLAFVLALTSKEDYAIVIAPLCVWSFLNERISSAKAKHAVDRKSLVLRGGWAVFATAYLLFVVKFAIPWYRNGETVHYARYFAAFGETPVEIATTMITRPQLLFSELVTIGSVLYFFRLLLPLGLPFRGWAQLLVAAPLFVLLCLNSIAMVPPGPYHHFHAPIVPLLIWAACVNVGSTNDKQKQTRRAKWILASSLACSVLFSFYPLSLRFWDPGHEMYWKNQYVQDERARQFENVIRQLPQDARIASTDYVHSRLTHFERSYDYSDYPRAVANYEDKVPDDTDYIVIDRKHKYSIGKYDRPEQIRELQSGNDDWELLPDHTNGYFFILKRRSSKSKPAE